MPSLDLLWRRTAAKKQVFQKSKKVVSWLRSFHKARSWSSSIGLWKDQLGSAWSCQMLNQFSWFSTLFSCTDSLSCHWRCCYTFPSFSICILIKMYGHSGIKKCLFKTTSNTTLTCTRRFGLILTEVIQKNAFCQRAGVTSSFPEGPFCLLAHGVLRCQKHNQTFWKPFVGQWLLSSSTFSNEQQQRGSWTFNSLQVGSTFSCGLNTPWLILWYRKPAVKWK